MPLPSWRGRTVEIDEETLWQFKRPEIRWPRKVWKEHHMPNVIDDIAQALEKHEKVITTVEGFMEEHAKSQDPRLQAVADRITIQTARLIDLLQKFPVVK